MKFYLLAIFAAGIVSLASAVFHLTGSPEPDDGPFVQAPVQRQVMPVSVSPITLRSIQQTLPVIRYAQLRHPGALHPLAI